MKKWIKKLFYFTIGLFPKSESKIVMESHPDFTDNARALYDYLLDNGKRKYKFIWLVDDPKKYNKMNLRNTKFININNPVSIKYIYHIATSKYLMFGNREIRWVDLNKQTVINLTHGLPFKKSKGLLPADSTFNYLLSSSEKINPYMADEFNSTTKKCFISGMPRNDVMFKKNEEAEKITSKYNKFILWLPTYNKHKNVSELNYNITGKIIPFFEEEDLKELNKFLEKNKILLILKFHPAQDLSNFKAKKYTNIKLWKNDDLVTRNLTLYSLLGKADALITDYSSVFADYLLMDKPIAFTKDKNNNFANQRGFCFKNIEEMTPGNKITNKTEFIKFIDDVQKNKDPYKKERNKIKNFYHKYQNGNSCQIITQIFDL